MTKLPLKFITLCALAGAIATFAQEAPTQQNNPEQPQYQQTAPQQPVYQQAAPQQPVYYAVPQNVQYVAMPPQGPQQNQPMYAPAPPQQAIVVPPKPRRSNLSFFMGIDMNLYLSSMTYKEERDYDYYYDDFDAEHSFDGKGINAGIAIGFLIKDFIGIRGFFGLGKQSGQSSYESSDVKCPSESCKDIDAEATDVAFGVSTTFFPFNRRLGPMYNAYVDGAFGISIHLYDDDYNYAERFDRDGSVTMFFKIEIGKLFPLNEYFNAGVGIAYSLDADSEQSSSSDYYNEYKQSIWVGMRFARKANKTEAFNN